MPTVIRSPEECGRVTASWLASLPAAERRRFLSALTSQEQQVLATQWHFWARDEQLAPTHREWSTWLLLAGRGFGKTRTGAEWVREEVESGRRGRFALVGRTAADARDVLVHGESGILATASRHFRPTWSSSRRLLRWPNGAIATTYSADEPDSLRGPQHDGAWADELAAWRYEDAWDQLQFGLRLGRNPQSCVTTTPRPTKIIRELMKSPDTYVTTGTTYDNAGNLPEKFFRGIIGKYEGTRLGRQELLAQILDDNPLALWKRSQLDKNRVKPSQVPPLKRIVVAVDPTVHDGTTPTSDTQAECGIIVCGIADLKGKTHGYILSDKSCYESPKGWGQESVTAYLKWKADRLVAEINQGGAMVEMVIRSINKRVSYRGVRATRGKYLRAEPVSALYEQDLIHHVGTFAELEDQMCDWIPGEDSPDRLDALVWGVTDLLLTGRDASGYSFS